MYVRTCLHSREPTRSLACKHSCGYNHSLMPSYTLISFLLLGSLGIGKRCFEIRNNSTNSNPFADGFLVLSKAQQGVLRVTRRLFGYCRKVAAARYVSSYSKPFGLLPKALPPGCLSEVGQPVLTLWCSWSIPCTLCRIILSCCTAWYVRCRAMPQPICGCLSPVPAHG